MQSCFCYWHVVILSNFDRSYALTPVYEAATRSISEEQPSTPAAKSDHDDANTKDVALPGVNLIFDGAELHPFDIVACLQARQPLSLIAEASSTSLAMKWQVNLSMFFRWCSAYHCLLSIDMCGTDSWTGSSEKKYFSKLAGKTFWH